MKVNKRLKRCLGMEEKQKDVGWAGNPASLRRKSKHKLGCVTRSGLMG